MDSAEKTNVTDNYEQFNMGVKKAFRPEWLDSENALFINKLNYCAKNFEPTHKLVSFFIYLILYSIHIDSKT